MIDLMNAKRVWHPWLRVQRVIVVIRETRWTREEWPTAKADLRDALIERGRIEKAGSFN